MRRSASIGLLFALGGLEAPAPAAQGEERRPIEVEASYTADVWAVVSGGLDRDVRYLDDLSLSLDADAEALVGWRGAQLYAQLLYNNGTGFTETLVGDTQTVSNIETGTRAVRLYEAWIDQRLGERLSLRLGLYDLNSEFDANETGALFINSSHGIGPDFSQSGENGPSIFPVTSLALRVEYAPAPGWRVRAAILDAVPGDPDRPARTAVRLRNEEGALLVGEIERRWEATRLTVGHWRYTRDAPRLDGTGEGRAEGAYVLAEHRLADGVGRAGPLSGWLRAGLASPNVHSIRTYLGGGLVLSRPLPGREEDALGLALARIGFGRPWRRLEGSEASELNLELTYRAQLSPHLAIQPDLQLIFDPSGVPGRGTAVALGLRTALTF